MVRFASPCFRYFLGYLCLHFTGRSSSVSPVGSNSGCTTIVGLSIRSVGLGVGPVGLEVGLASSSSLGSVGSATSGCSKYGLTIVVLNSVGRLLTSTIASSPSIETSL